MAGSAAEPFEVSLERRENVGFGFSIAGGKSAPNAPPMPIVISKIKPNSPASDDQRLRIGLQLLAIDDQELGGVTLQTAGNLLRNAAAKIKLRLKETKIDWSIAGKDDGSTPSYLPTRSSAAQAITLSVAYERVRILYNFKGRQSDELDLKQGDIVHVTGRSEDGWCVGECQRTGSKGAFPATYAVRIRLAPQVVDALYSDIEQYQTHTPPAGGADVLYEQLPEAADQSASPNSGDPYGSAVFDAPVALPSEDNYSRMAASGSISTSQPHDVNILYAHVDRDATVVNGDVYAVVPRIANAQNADYDRLPGDDGSDAMYAHIPGAAGSRTSTLVIKSTEPGYSRSTSVDDEDSVSATYARLPNARDDDGTDEHMAVAEAGGAPPPIPDRRYDLTEMQPPTVEVEFSAAGAGGDYEHLPDSDIAPPAVTATVSEDLYEDLPDPVNVDLPPALPDAPPIIQRTASKSDIRARKKQQKAEEKARKKAEAKAKREESRRRKQAAKDEKLRKKRASRDAISTPAPAANANDSDGEAPEVPRKASVRDLVGKFGGSSVNPSAMALAARTANATRQGVVGKHPTNDNSDAGSQ